MTDAAAHEHYSPMSYRYLAHSHGRGAVHHTHNARHEDGDWHEWGDPDVRCGECKYESTGLPKASVTDAQT